jgi:hypothetical protein
MKGEKSMDQLLAGLLTAVISATVSLTVTLITVLVTRSSIRAEREKLERELQRSMTAKLYDLRLEVYPQAITITEALRRSHMAAQGENLGEAYFGDVLARLDDWHATKAGFIMSHRSLEQLYALRRILHEKPETDGRYTQEHIERIAVAKGDFRISLRKDIQLLYEEEAPTELRDD